ncbi:hypothetical protein CHKEEEPN_4540 [Methylorubrum podarium]|jgi:methyl-accepting chemotaxis protein|nr:hypothetical protein CHKEEEPN_4540 [Methylorubrum podarium]
MSRWKLFKMDIVKKMRWERPLDFDLSESQNMPVVSQDAPKPTDSLTSILRLVQTDADASVSVMAPPSSSQDWANLIERVRAAAHRTREVEAQAQEQEQRVHELLERVRDDIKLASERVRAAETRAANVQAQAEQRIRAAEERAEAAEERARIAEDWLKQVHEAIVSEFSVLTEMPSKVA